MYIRDGIAYAGEQVTVWHGGDIDIAPEELYENGVTADRADIA